MKLTSVEMHPANSLDVAVLSFRDPRRQNPYNVKSIEGLDADEIVARYYGGSGSSKFYNLSLEKRDIVVVVELNPAFGSGESFSDLRDGLYRLISSSRTGVLQLQFKNLTTVVAAISGFVKKLEAPHFEKTPEVKITIECSDPMLRALTATEIDVEELDPAGTAIVDDLSTSPHGFRFSMSVLTAQDFLIITNLGETEWSFEVAPTGGFEVGDIIHFSSDLNDKYLYLERGIDLFHLADKIMPGSIWPIIFPGENYFELENPTSWQWEEITYYPTYWGV